MNPANLTAVRAAVATRFLAESQPELRGLFAVMKAISILKESNADPAEIARQTEIVAVLWASIIAPMEVLP